MDLTKEELKYLITKVEMDIECTEGVQHELTVIKYTTLAKLRKEKTNGQSKREND